MDSPPLIPGGCFWNLLSLAIIAAGVGALAYLLVHAFTGAAT